MDGRTPKWNQTPTWTSQESCRWLFFPWGKQSKVARPVITDAELAVCQEFLPSYSKGCIQRICQGAWNEECHFIFVLQGSFSSGLNSLFSEYNIQYFQSGLSFSTHCYWMSTESQLRFTGKHPHLSLEVQWKKQALRIEQVQSLSLC